MESKHGAHRDSQRKRPRVPWLALLAAVLLVAVIPFQAGAKEESCTACHKNPDFRVTNKKLYDYYQLWKDSVHAQEGVACSDCHGGDPDASDKATAHGRKGIGASVKTSPVNYRNIPKTCAQCHEAFYDNYRQSKHFKHLTDNPDELQGPNCVTCHQSVSTTVLNVNTVRKTCEQCHNEKTGNHPEIPARAEFLLNKFLSIHRFYRYMTVKGAVLQEAAVFKQIEQLTNDLFINWHTFDLDKVERQTLALLSVLKQKRNEIRKKLRAR